MSLDAAVIEELAQAIVRKLQAGGSNVKPRLLSYEHAATYLGRSQNALKQLVKKKRLKVTKIDGRTQFDVMELDRLIEACTYTKA